MGYGCAAGVGAARQRLRPRVRIAGLFLSLLGGHVGNGGDHGDSELRPGLGRPRRCISWATVSAGCHLPLFERYPEQSPGRAVFLGTPCLESRAAEQAAQLRLVSALMGPSVAEELLRPRERHWTFGRRSESSPAASRSGSDSSSPVSRKMRRHRGGQRDAPSGRGGSHCAAREPHGDVGLTACGQGDGLFPQGRAVFVAVSAGGNSPNVLGCERNWSDRVQLSTRSWLFESQSRSRRRRYIASSAALGVISSGASAASASRTGSGNGSGGADAVNNGSSCLWPSASLCVAVGAIEPVPL